MGTVARAWRGLAVTTTSASLSTLFVSATAGGQVYPGALAHSATVVTITAGTPIAVGGGPGAIAITPNGKTAYVVNSTSGTVTPIDTTTDKPGPAITVGRYPAAIAITPNGQTAYVANGGSGTVTPITTANNTAGPPITVGRYPAALAITPNGQTVYVANHDSGTVTAIATATDRVTAQIEAGKMPQAVVVSPDGKTAYVANFGSHSVSPIATATNRAGAAIPVGSGPLVLAMAPHHQSLYVVNYGSGTVTPISTATDKAGRPIRVGTHPQSIAFSANGGTAVVANEGSNSDTTIDTATGGASTSPVGNAPVSVLIIVVTYGPTARPDRFTLSVCDSDNGPVPTGRNGYVVVTAGPGYEVRRTQLEGFGPLPRQGSRSPVAELAGQQGALRRIPVGIEPGPIAFSPSNGTVYVVNEGSGNVTPLVLRRS